MITIFLISAVLATVVLFAGRRVLRSHKRARIYGHRVALPMPTIRSTQLAPLGANTEPCERCWLTLSETFGVEPGRLRVTDRFDSELRNLDHLPDSWLLRTIIAAESGAISLRADDLKTVGDVLRLVRRGDALI